MQTANWCRERDTVIGPAWALFIEALLGDRSLDGLRSAQGVLRFAQRYGVDHVDAVCARAHAVGEYRYHTIKAILMHDDRQSLPGLAPITATVPTAPPRHASSWTTFSRDPATDFGEERIY